MTALTTTIQQDHIQFGAAISISFERTLRIPDDGKTYPLPPGIGKFPIKQVSDFADKVPDAWRERGGVFIPMYQREALWLRFQARHWKPNAVKVGTGKINAISGERWAIGLQRQPQNYIVCPPQLWLDGINSGDGIIRQFIAMPLGEGYTVEGQLTGQEKFGGIQLMVFEPKPGKFPDQPPKPSFMERLFGQAQGFGIDAHMSLASTEMGLGAGGQMRQKIYPDEHGLDTWDMDNKAEIFVHIVNSETYQAITGELPPPSPITAKTYTKYGFPWFDLYDEQMGDVEAADTLKRIKSVKTLDQAKGKPAQDGDESLDVENVITYDLDEVIDDEQRQDKN